MYGDDGEQVAETDVPIGLKDDERVCGRAPAYDFP